MRKTIVSLIRLRLVGALLVETTGLAYKLTSQK